LGTFCIGVPEFPYISVNTGGAPDANAIPVPQGIAEKAMDAAACPNASAMLFVGAKIS